MSAVETPSLYGDVGRAAAHVVAAAERLEADGRGLEATRLLARATARLETLIDEDLPSDGGSNINP